VSKQIKTTKQVKTTTKVTGEQAHRFWLAGLGAFSIAQKQGKVLFEGLVSEGKGFQTRSEKLARQVGSDVGIVVKSRLKPVQLRLEAVRRDAEAKLERGVGRVLSYAGIPSKADVDTLVTRIDALSKQLRAAK
jgi:poly(hydroxyalkanoate) granule-associated protein